MEITTELDKKIDAVIAEYPVKKSAAMVCMHLIQETYGYFDDASVRYVASKLEVEPIEVYGMLSFYPMFTQKPKGRVHIKVCRTLSCALAGSIKTMSEISKRINCPVDGTSEDGVYTLEFVECLGNCVKSPNIQVNDKLFDGITPEKTENFLETVAKLDAAGKLAARSSLEKPAGADFNSAEYKG